jgi:hypothetical protein
VAVEVGMKFEFNQGVPNDCIKWLWENVGEGNIINCTANKTRRERQDTDSWYYERMSYEIPSTNPEQDSGSRHVPTIFIKDEKKAVLFALRWAQ